MVALREAEGAVPKDLESDRNRLLREAGLAVQPGRAAGRSATPLREEHPADRVPAAPVAPPGAGLEARHLLLEAEEESQQAVARPRPPGPRAEAARPKRQQRALRGPPALERRGERSQARARPSRVLAVGNLLERRAPKRAPRKRAAAAQPKRPQPVGVPVPVPKREGPRPAEAERAPALRVAPGDSFFLPRARCPRRGYSQVAALFSEYYYRHGGTFPPKYYCRHARAFFPTRLSED